MASDSSWQKTLEEEEEEEKSCDFDSRLLSLTDRNNEFITQEAGNIQ